MARILVVDDDQLINDLMSHVVKNLGHEVMPAFTLDMGFKLARDKDFDVVFLDVRLPDGSGLEALEKFRLMPAEPEVVIITGYSEPEGIAMAIKSGAWDYIRKPITIASISLILTRALQYREEKWKSRKVPIVFRREDIIGHSPSLNNALEQAAKAAQGNFNVLLTGETGTGKELFARAIHENSRRSDKPFVVVDCAVLPETLVESLLFGYEKGAFTGADHAKEGLISQADKGSLFLDEIGELPLSIQKTFLRVIQEHRYRPLGARHENQSDFRLIAATNRDLDQMVEKHRFRRDLLFRLKSLVIELPPLGQRKEDIRNLVNYYLDKFSKHYGLEIKGVSPDFIYILESYDWSGNVRELINTLEQVMAVACQEPVLFPYHLPQEIRIKVTQNFLEFSKGKEPMNNFPEKKTLPLQGLLHYKDFRRETERNYLERLLTAAKGNRKEACHLSKLSRTHLFDLLKKHSLTT
jgi:two-component system, NtrC family, response regulator